MEFQRTGPTKVHEDNAACIAITAKPVHRTRSKHICVKYQNVQEAFQNGEIELIQVWTSHQVADIFTKSLGPSDFIRCRETLMGRVPYSELVAKHMKPGVDPSQQPGSKKAKAAVAAMEEYRVSETWPSFQVPMDVSHYGAAILGFEVDSNPGYGEEVTMPELLCEEEED